MAFVRKNLYETWFADLILYRTGIPMNRVPPIHAKPPWKCACDEARQILVTELAAIDSSEYRDANYYYCVFFKDKAFTFQLESIEKIGYPSGWGIAEYTDVEISNLLKEAMTVLWAKEG